MEKPIVQPLRLKSDAKNVHQAIVLPVVTEQFKGKGSVNLPGIQSPHPLPISSSI